MTVRVSARSKSPRVARAASSSERARDGPEAESQETRVSAF